MNEGRKEIIQIAFVVVGIIFLVKLFFIQVVDGTYEQLANSKFIALSGHGREEGLRARKAGFDAYMTKPVDIREMKKLISSGAYAGESQ